MVCAYEFKMTQVQVVIKLRCGHGNGHEGTRMKEMVEVQTLLYCFLEG